jgi:hypothetical protein
MSMTHFSSSQAPTEDRHGRLITCSVDQLQPHPSLVRLNIVPSAPEYSAAMKLRSQGVDELVTITNDHYILAGHTRWDLARRQQHGFLSCIQLDLNDEEALLWLIQRHQRLDSLNAFNRILLALELEPWFKERARANQQLGGQQKGRSNLTEADRLDVRAEIAAAAGVSAGNVTKVKHLASTACPQVLDALRSGEVSIHRASLWLKTPEEQAARLRLHRDIRGVESKIGSLLSVHRCPQTSESGLLDLKRIVGALTTLGSKRTTSIVVSEVRISGQVLLLSTDLLRALETHGKFEL